MTGGFAHIELQDNPSTLSLTLGRYSETTVSCAGVDKSYLEFG